MPFVQLDDGELHYQIDGPQGAPVLVLSNALGTDLHMWDAQVDAFSQSFRVLRYDTRGHGKSLVSQGPYTIEQLGQDVLALLDALQIDKAHFCGLSMGGLTGQWLGIHASDRLHKLVLSNTAAKIGTPDIWNERITLLEHEGAQGMLTLAQTAPQRWFTPEFTASHPEQVKAATDQLAATSPFGYAACCAALRDADYLKQVSSIAVDTLIICCSHDAVTTVADGHYLQNHIDGSQLSDYYAAHMSSVELGQVFTLRVTEFLLS
ncbi:3-oxoadipate enol-lactonase [Pseudomonas huanghezhanensis]|uniref:3-oxoadipate enol-lactonase n=1 Tax=Pseudomonas huanghezhanensis TaxID=3002903 RepID=UPI00228696F1|nr:3-oxoadipate enol-lactonase [Pseudomonas sp. BSw22131]